MLTNNKTQTLSVKYRPKTFEELVGQDEIKVILQNQIKNNALKHVYLFCGGAGTGKTSSCRILANIINEGKGHPIELDCATHNGVDDMRAIQEDCKKKPLEGKYKILILDEIQMISKNAWNALLKLFEEPPSYVIFMLATTNPEEVPQTILSRVQRFNFKYININDIINRLIYILNNENINSYSMDAISYIARQAKGGLRTSITYLEKCLDYSKELTLENAIKVINNSISEDVLLQLLQFILFKQCREALLVFDNICFSGTTIKSFYEIFLEFIENCVKFLIVKDANSTILSNNIANWLIQSNINVNILKDYLYKLISLNSNYTYSDLKILIESWIIKECN